MGMKKACSCGYWNEAQQECLYAGSACIRDDERKKLKVTQDWIEKKANKAIEIVLTGKNVKDFIRSFVKEIQGK